MSGPRSILAALADGPKTNAQLQELTCDHGGGVARTAAKLRQQGRVIRADTQNGRGRPALYALADSRFPPTPGVGQGDQVAGG
jgi:hypothetical protein